MIFLCSFRDWIGSHIGEYENHIARDLWRQFEGLPFSNFSTVRRDSPSSDVQQAKFVSAATPFAANNIDVHPPMDEIGETRRYFTAVHNIHIGALHLKKIWCINANNFLKLIFIN